MCFPFVCTVVRIPLLFTLAVSAAFLSSRRGFSRIGSRGFFRQTNIVLQNTILFDKRAISNIMVYKELRGEIVWNLL